MKRASAPWASLLILLAASLLLVANSLGAKTQEVPMISCGDHLCVEVRLAGTPPLRLALDFACERSYVKSDIVRRFRLITEPMLFVKGTPVLAYLRTKDLAVTIGNVDLGLHSFDVIDPDKLRPPASVAGRDLSVDEDGGISVDIYDNRLVELKAKEQRLKISETLSKAILPSGTSGQLKMVSRGDYGPRTLVATGFAVGSNNVAVQLDTVFVKAIYLTSGLNPQIYASDTRIRRLTSSYKNILPLELYGTTTLSCGSYSISKQAQLWIPEEGEGDSRVPYGATLGLDVFRSAEFVFDFFSKRIACRQ